jgi:hypothetical protein
MGSNIVRFDAVRSVPLASITSSYTPIGAPLGHAMRVLHFINNTNGDMMVSFDGTTDNVPVLAEGFSLYDLTSDQDTNESFRYQIGTQLYVKYITAPTLPADGAFYLVAVYGKGE